MDENFDTRRAHLSPAAAGRSQMVEDCAACGASAKFAGSGGAIIGTYRDEAMFERSRPARRGRLAAIKPQIVDRP